LSLSGEMLERPLSYRLWQAPFAESKFSPVLRHNDLGRVRRVLDVGCGPGTNTHHFAGVDYLGIDLNEAYVDYARRLHGRDFEVADATEFEVPAGERFDFVLINSFLHHIDDDGCIHVMELVLPPELSAGRALARLDRGDFARPLEHWRSLLGESFEEVVFEPYRLGIPRWRRTTLWHMVYFKGRAVSGRRPNPASAHPAPPRRPPLGPPPAARRPPLG
jgi:SAM-dependent methyltransferase